MSEDKTEIQAPALDTSPSRLRDYTLVISGTELLDDGPNASSFAGSFVDDLTRAGHDVRSAVFIEQAGPKTLGRSFLKLDGTGNGEIGASDVRSLGQRCYEARCSRLSEIAAATTEQAIQNAGTPPAAPVFAAWVELSDADREGWHAAAAALLA